MTTNNVAKVFIDGHEVIGDVEFIRSLLGFSSVSAQTNAVMTEKTPKTKEKTNKVDEYFDNTSLVQVNDKVVKTTEKTAPSNMIETNYKKEYDETNKLWRISHSICGSAKYKDKVTGEEKVRRFNKYAIQLANNEIKKLVLLDEFKGQLFKFKKPFNDGTDRAFWCFGFRTEELTNKALEKLPKLVLKEEPKNN